MEKAGKEERENEWKGGTWELCTVGTVCSTKAWPAVFWRGEAVSGGVIAEASSTVCTVLYGMEREK